jgi:hypothetical protein
MLKSLPKPGVGLLRFSSWLTELHGDFGDEVPDPSKAGRIVSAVSGVAGTKPSKFIGSCTNGIAFLTDSNTVLKFTIDEQEAVLWGQLWGWRHPNVAECYGSWQLVSRETGGSIVYVIHVEYVPHPLDTRLSDLLHDASEKFIAAIRNDRQVRTSGQLGGNLSTIIYLRQLRQAAAVDKRINGIIEVMLAFSDRNVHISDLQPDNFRLAADKQTIKLIDPSTPKGANGRVGKVFYEGFGGLGFGHIVVD